MKNFVLTTTMALILSATVAFGQVSMDDLIFKPAAKGGDKTVQDDINAAVKNIKSNPEKWESRIVKVKSGIAVVAVGSSFYFYADPEQLKNPTAIRISKRLAYVN
jgi:hypothetical protein